jgi:deoxycytidylate deaminase
VYPSDDYVAIAKGLMVRDEQDATATFGQNVSGTFPMADLFVDVSRSKGAILDSVTRFVRLVFGFEFITPTRDENGMFLAQGAALRSAELGRQVGAAITTVEGSVVALGANELPRAGGGQVWHEDRADARDWTVGHDVNTWWKQENVRELLQALRTNDWLAAERAAETDDVLLATASKFLKGTRVMNAIEFGRAVHAEMAAITDAAFRGVSVRGHTLYTTTFPCHACARHIIAAGIIRVVYIEPYAKSLATTLHDDAFVVDAPSYGQPSPAMGNLDAKVRCEPFVGIAPRLYIPLFSMIRRKTADGAMVQWEPSSSEPRFALRPGDEDYFERENLAVKKILTVAPSGPSGLSDA